MDTRLSDEDIKISIEKRGKLLTRKILEVLSNRHPHYKAITSETGKILLSQHIELLQKAYSELIENNGDVRPEIRIRIEVLNDLFNIWAKIIESQEKLLNELKGE